jgi:hypothetical protein
LPNVTGFVLPAAPQEAPRLVVRAGVLGEPRQRGEQCPDERLAQPHRRPLLQRTEVHFKTDDGEMRVEARPDVDRTFKDLHECLVR